MKANDQPRHFDICDEIAEDYQGRPRSTSTRASMMAALVNNDPGVSDNIKAVLTILINAYEEAESR